MSARKKQKSSSNNKTTEQAPIESIVVRLKPVIGIRPRTYVPVIWGLALAAAVFLLLILPGLRQNGTWITFESSPPDVSVLVDDIRLGATGEKIFVAKGLRKITLRRVGFEFFETEIRVAGRIFASRVFPRKEIMSYGLQPVADFNHLAYGTSEFAAWAATGPEQGRYAIPPVLTQAARDAVAADTGNGENLFSEVLPMSIDERHLADILRAQFIINSGGTAPGASNIVDFMNYISAIADEKPETAGSVLQLVNAERLESSDYLNNLAKAANEPNKLVTGFEDTYAAARSTSRFPTRLYGNRLFVSVPGIIAAVGDLEVITGGYYPRSGASPALAAVDPFSISALEVTNSDYSSFLGANPDWSTENRSTLVIQTLADESYLSDWSISGPPPGSGRLPVTNVSWHAAVAYTEWFTSRYLSETGFIARLPREDEWEVAARLNALVENTADLPSGLNASESADTGSLGIRGMAGNVREWALNPYRFNENLFRPADGSPAYQSVDESLAAPERPVRGGAYIDSNLAFPAAVRGGLPPETTSPVIGFRLVIVAIQ